MSSGNSIKGWVEVRPRRYWNSLLKLDGLQLPSDDFIFRALTGPGRLEFLGDFIPNSWGGIPSDASVEATIDYNEWILQQSEKRLDHSQLYMTAYDWHSLLRLYNNLPRSGLETDNAWLMVLDMMAVLARCYGSYGVRAVLWTTR